MNTELQATPFTLELTAKILIRWVWMGMAMLILWFIEFIAGGQWHYDLTLQMWSGLTRHEFDLIHLCGTAILKSVVFVGFLFPYLSIRLILKGQHDSTRHNNRIHRRTGGAFSSNGYSTPGP